MAEAGGRPWTYEEDIYLLQDTGETLIEKALKLDRSVKSCKVKMQRMFKSHDTLEKIVKEKELFFEYMDYMTIKDMAESLNRTIAYINLRIRSYKDNGTLERKTKKEAYQPSWKDKYIISNYNRIDKQILADYVSMTLEELEQKVGILRKRGLMLPESSPLGNETWVHLKTLRKTLYEEGTRVKIGRRTFTIEKDLGELILCKNKNYRECFKKIDFIIDDNLLKRL